MKLIAILGTSPPLGVTPRRQIEWCVTCGWTSENGKPTKERWDDQVAWTHCRWCAERVPKPEIIGRLV